MRSSVESLLNLIEELNSKVIELDAENQRLKDEINRLKGEQGKPDIKGKKPRGLSNNYSSEKARKTPKKHCKSRKKETIKIDREQILEYPQDQLPAGYEGEFGTGIKALVISLYYGGNMTQSKLLEFLENIGICMSTGHLSHLLIKNHAWFEREKEEICEAGLASSPWQDLDQTSARVAGINYTTNIICNPLFTVYVTTARQDRLSVLKVLQNGLELEFLLNQVTYELLSQFEVPPKWQDALKQLPQTVFSGSEFQSRLESPHG